MDYVVEPGSEGLGLDLAELGGLHEAHLRLAAGEVSLAGTSSPARLEVDGVTDEPVRVRLQEGVLSVEQAAAWSGGFVRPRAAVTLTVPPAAALTVHTESADVVAAGLAGQTSFATVSGELTATCLSGDVSARTVSGEVALDGVAGRLRVESVSGHVAIVGGIVQELTVGTITGEVVADLDPRPDARCSCRTASGPVTVRLPADASIAFDAGSLTGHIDVPDSAERSEEEPPLWARGWSDRAQAWSGAAQSWAGRAGEWAGRAGEWADVLAGAGARLLGDAPGAWARTCRNLGGIGHVGRVVRGRLGHGDATLSMATVFGDISLVCAEQVEAVA